MFILIETNALKNSLHKSFKTHWSCPCDLFKCVRKLHKVICTHDEAHTNRPESIKLSKKGSLVNKTEFTSRPHQLKFQHRLQTWTPESKKPGKKKSNTTLAINKLTTKDIGTLSTNSSQQAISWYHRALTINTKTANTATRRWLIPQNPYSKPNCEYSYHVSSWYHKTLTKLQAKS